MFAEAHPGWTFDGVDPSAEMLKLAATDSGTARLARDPASKATSAARRSGPFDAATCLSDAALHRLSRNGDARRPMFTAASSRRALRAGPLSAFRKGAGSERALWLSRHEALHAAAGLDPQARRSTRNAIRHANHILAPEQDEAILREAGFSNVSLFYAGFSIPRLGGHGVRRDESSPWSSPLPLGERLGEGAARRLACIYSSPEWGEEYEKGVLRPEAAGTALSPLTVTLWPYRRCGK